VYLPKNKVKHITEGITWKSDDVTDFGFGKASLKDP
jgi:hypothetical protein